MKRAADLVLAAAGLVLLSPLLLFAALLVRLDGPGPLLFPQVRIGRLGRPFILFKFRTMRPAGSAARLSAEDAGRITRWGRVLRSSKLDELPQLINVLAGQMSLVGPRPEISRYVALWSEADRALILSVRPGLTEFASIVYRNEETLLAAHADPEAYYRHCVMPHKLRYYRFYVRRASLGLDLWLIWQTVRALLGRPTRLTLPLAGITRNQAPSLRPAGATAKARGDSW
jgi:lipopolysaccharide/colanic/teichoic acid biosynthesis glycosyltransferase